MDLKHIKQQLKALEPELPHHLMVQLMTCEREERTLHLYITQRFRKRARKAKMWASKGMLTALKNAAYGFDPEHARSRGGSDGIFLVDRDFKPTNTMITRLFDGFLDKETQLVDEIAQAFDVSHTELEAARLVSHHTRLLGVLVQQDEVTQLILVDVDDTKKA